MVKLYENMASSFDKYLNEEVEEEESIKECNDSFVESTNKVLNRKNESLQPNEDLDEYCDRLLDTLSEAIGYDRLCTEIIDYVSVQTLVEVLEHIAEIYKIDVDSYIMNESDESLNESAWDELKSFLR